ncbi:MAG TPA: hypothetical protein VLE51_03945 [Candidatus Saccharimonadales bacterium]|nr:hypothetical protein [Candidatus Saccharimonadales bacterium]HSX27491.1 hypothetical protein [Patescibacteria group bacterium]
MGNSEVVIERLAEYSPDDAAALGVLLHAESPDRPPTPLPERMIRDHIDHPDQRVMIVARLATTGMIVSSETLNTICSPDVGVEGIGKMAWLGFVSTHPYYRRQGIFGKVWYEGLGWCEENEAAVMQFTSNPHNTNREAARRFYLEHGAIIKDTDPFWLDVQKALAIEAQ